MPYIGQGLQQGRRQLHTFTATASQTTFSVSYSPGYVDVYQNGILLAPSDYTATNGTTVVLAIGAAVSDEITIIAQHLFSVADVVSASSGGTFSGDVTITGNLTVQGTTITVDTATTQTVDLGDSDKIRLGDDNDLQIFHNNGNNRIQAENGPLFLQSNDTASGVSITGKNAAETMAKFLRDGAVELYHNNVKTLETTSAGATVTGNLLNSAATQGNAFVANTSSTWNALEIFQDRGVADSASGIAFRSQSGTAPAGIVSVALNTTGGREELAFLTSTGNVTYERMRIDESGNVGIGQNSPSYKLEISGTGDTVQYIANANPSGTQGRTLIIRDNYASSSQDSKISFAATSSPGNDVYLGKRTTSNAGYFHLTNSGGVEHMTVNMANGNVGIGTTSPIAKLQITPPNEHQDSFRIYRGGSSGYELNYLNMSLYQGNTVFNTTSTDSSGKRYLFQINGTEKFRIDQNGEVGIGEDSPENILHIKTSAAGGPQIELDSTSGTANSAFINFDGTSLQLSTQRDMVDGSKRDTAKSWGGINIVGATTGSYIQLQTSEGNNNAVSTKLKVESNGDTNIVAAQNYVGGAPGGGTSRFSVLNADSGKWVSQMRSDNTGAHGLFVRAGNTASTYTAHFTGYDENNVHMSIDGLGRVTKPKNVMFSVTRSGSNYTLSQGSVYIFNVAQTNIGSHFNTSNGRFTAPVAGNYYFDFFSIYYGVYTNAWTSIRLNGNRMADQHFSPTNNAWHNVSGHYMAYLSANDYVEVYNGGVSVQYHGSTWSRFSGFLVG